MVRLTKTKRYAQHYADCVPKTKNSRFKPQTIVNASSTKTTFVNIPDSAARRDLGNANQKRHKRTQ